MEEVIKTVLCIPGQWKTRSDLVAAIAKSSEGFAYVGGILMDLKTKQYFSCEVRTYDPQLRADFEQAAIGRLDGPTLQAIEKHTYAVYLTGIGGSTTTSRNLMRAAAGIL